MGDLAAHGDTAMVILGASYLEAALEDLLTERFVPLNPEETKRLFDSSAGGILGSLAAKIRITRACGYISEEKANDLLLIANIRNIFAHSMHNIDFDSLEVTQDCARFLFLKELKKLDKNLVEVPIVGSRQQFKEVVTALWLLLRFLVGDSKLKFMFESEDGSRTELMKYTEKSE